MEMMPMLLIITMETYTLGKIAITAVPMKGKKKYLLAAHIYFCYMLYRDSYLWQMQAFPRCR